MKIILKPTGNIDNNILEELKERLKQTFGCTVEVIPEAGSLERAYDSKRRQYLASELLVKLKKSGVAKGEKVLGIVDVDLYAPGLNFVFGQADIASSAAIISLCRLRQEYYDLPSDEALFLDRATKEAGYEPGNPFRLGHR
ncbi:MAG: peptidase zinc-dependent, partial [Chloroflexi bacterium]|nr:peptidase zinc-dependent [Chloroflexota bacterium]